MDKNFFKKYTRPAICLMIVLTFFIMFFVRLVDWQLIQGEYYRNEVSTRSNYVLNSEATRGEIVDVNGNAVQTNVTNYTLTVNKLYISPNMSINDVIIQVFELLSYRDALWIDKLPLICTDDSYSFKEKSESELEALRSENMLNLSVYATATEYIDALARRYKAEDITDRKLLRDVLSVRYNMEKKGFNSTTPYTFAENLDEESVAIISEFSQNAPYLDIVTTYDRICVDGTLMPHVLGITGALTAEEYEAHAQDGYSYNDTIGKFGVELAMEEYLKGVGGSKTVSKTTDGTVVSVVDVTPAQPGNTVYLTLDSRLQKVANEALAENIAAARQTGAEITASSGTTENGEDCFTGAAVMLDVRDFSVLVASSAPTYDITRYNESEYYLSLLEDENLPLYNRAFVGSFAPGSVVKPIVALAALEEGVISEYTPIYCKKHYDYYPSNVVNCMYYHGSLDLHGALIRSCNYYFAEVGRQLGIETMYLYMEKVGLGEYTGIELGEGKGVLAGRDSNYWVAGNTVQAAIGQSDNTFTPMQLATYCATIANDGVRLRTHMINKVTTYDRSEVVLYNDPENPEVVDTLDVDPYNLLVVQNCMRSVAANQSGTAYSVFGNYPVKIAAKTGTAENSGSDHAVFICYAPYDNPEVAVSVVLEHGVRGSYAMNVAKAMLDAYFFPEEEETQPTTSAVE